MLLISCLQGGRRSCGLSRTVHHPFRDSRRREKSFLFVIFLCGVTWNCIQLDDEPYGVLDARPFPSSDWWQVQCHSRPYLSDNQLTRLVRLFLFYTFHVVLFSLHRDWRDEKKKIAALNQRAGKRGERNLFPLSFSLLQFDFGATSWWRAEGK